MGHFIYSLKNKYMPWSRFIIHIYSHENDELKNGKGPVKGPSAEGDHPRGTEKKINILTVFLLAALVALLVEVINHLGQ